MKRFFAIALSVAVLATSCNSDEETPENVQLTSEEASAKIVETGNAVSADVVTMVQSEGVDALLAFAELFADFDQFSGRKDQRGWTKEKLDLLTEYFVVGSVSTVVDDDDEFSFEDIKGVFEWNASLEEFEKTGEASTFKVLFPSEGSSTNNAVLELKDLQFITITEEDEWGSYETVLPTAIDGSLEVDGVTYISLTAAATWPGDDLPETASINLFVSPFTFQLNFDDTNSTSASLSASLATESATLMGVDLDVDFIDAAKEEPAKIGGFVQYGSLKLSGLIDIAGFDANAYDDNGEMKEGFDPNEYIDLEVLLDDQKIGDIWFDEDIAYIVYLDGEKEILEELLEDVIAEIEKSMEDFFGEEEDENF